MYSLPPTRQTGLLIIAVTFLFAPGMDILAKLLTAFHSPGQVVLGRFLVQTVMLVPLLAFAAQWSRPRLGHLLAGSCLAAALLCLNAALTVMPVANAIAIFFVEPLILTVLSAIFLKETIGWRRIGAVIVGLIGAMIVIRPNWAAFGPLAVLPLGTAIFFAIAKRKVRCFSTPQQFSLEFIRSGICIAALQPDLGDRPDVFRGPLAEPEGKSLALTIAVKPTCSLAEQVC